MSTQLQSQDPKSPTFLGLRLYVVVATLPFALSFGLLAWFIFAVVLEKGESTYWWQPGPRATLQKLTTLPQAASQQMPVDLDHHAFWLVTFVVVCLTVLALASLFLILKVLEREDL